MAGRQQCFSFNKEFARIWKKHLTKPFREENHSSKINVFHSKITAAVVVLRLQRRPATFYNQQHTFDLLGKGEYDVAGTAGMAGNTGPGERRRSGRKRGDLVLPCLVSSLSLSLCSVLVLEENILFSTPSGFICLSLITPTPFHLFPPSSRSLSNSKQQFSNSSERQPNTTQARGESQERRRRKPQEERTCACWEGPRCRHRGAWQAPTPSNPGRDRGKVCAANGGN